MHNAHYANGDWMLFSSKLSPFSLKAELLCRHAGLAIRLVPAEVRSFTEGLRLVKRQRAVIAGKLPVHWPPLSANADLLLVPYLFSAGSRHQPEQNIFDSTAMAHWLEKHSPVAESFPSLLPGDDAAAGFLIQLINDYADEFGLYMAHHNRWVTSAADNDAGKRLAEECSAVLPLPFMRRVYGAHFARRQVRRLPYLFSVAPEAASHNHLAADRQPPTREGFPATHQLLDDAFLRFLSAVEAVLSEQEFLFGHRLSLADTAVYGQLAMNADDPSAAILIRKKAPNTWAWVERLRRGTVQKTHARFIVSPLLKPLLAEVCRMHVPLMQQNLGAYEKAGFSSAHECNAAAFNAGKALYDGELDGQPFRAVIKSFQVDVWRDCRKRWLKLSTSEQQSVTDLLPDNHGLNRDV